MASLVDSIKNIAANIQLRQLEKGKSSEPVEFNNFMKRAKEFLIILPAEKNYAEEADDIFTFLITQEKKVSVFTTIERYNFFPFRMKTQLIDFTEDEINKVGLPAKSLQTRLLKRRFDAAIDLTIERNNFLASIIRITNAKYKIGFEKENSDSIYNVQITADKEKPGASYAKLLSALKLF
ncbi:MAG: glycosyltransferase family 9 protein [Chlorobi bacterium]|nr:glycosyltransferase family 9 protein [Chlorobiota bacterium]